MKIAILTESSKEGKNQILAQFCSIYCDSVLTKAKIDIYNFSAFENVWINHYDSFIMIVPEWNGSFPFTVKKLIDDSGYPSLFQDKDILLIGTSASSMSNIIGIEQLNYILQFVGANVYKKKVYIPNISKDMDVDLEVRLCKTIKNFFKKNFKEI
jgi:hypothetical protein